MIRIVTPASGIDCGTKILAEDGSNISGVTAVDIAIRPNDAVTATLEIYTAGLDIHAHPLLGLETVRAAAEAHGFVLVPKGADAGADLIGGDGPDA
jgi:hypothetical protein